MGALDGIDVVRVTAVFVGVTLLAAIGAACLAQWVPPLLLPQVGLLAVAAWATRRGGSLSVAAVWLLGWGFDALSAAAPGTHSFLFVLVWITTRVASHQVHLRGAGAFATYVFVLALGATLIASISLGVPRPSLHLILPALLQATVNGAAAGPARWLLWKGLEPFEEGEPIRSTGLTSGAALS